MNIPFSSRKGDHPVTVVLWVVSLVIVLLVLIVLVINLRNSFFIDTDSPICASQIRGHSALAAVSNDQVAPQISCPTEIISQQVTGSAEANSLIAEQMAKCWSQWGRGEISLFGRQEGTYCHICSMVTIGGVSEVRGLPEYLKQTQYRDVTYDAYLTNGMGSMATVADWSMGTQEPIAVVFHYSKGLTGLQRIHDMIITAGLGGNPGTGAIRGAGAGAVGAGAGLFAIGVAAGVVGAPVVIPGVVATTIVVGGATLGGGTGLLASMHARPEMNTTALVVVRPLNQDEITQLGCQYAPVANS